VLIYIRCLLFLLPRRELLVLLPQKRSLPLLSDKGARVFGAFQLLRTNASRIVTDEEVVLARARTRLHP